MGLQVGLVGAGRIGTLHARTLAAHPRVDGLSVSDPDAERAASVAATAGAAHAESPEALLEWGAEALVIAAATPAHAPLIRLAARAGLPCFCEKPIALDLETTDQALRDVEESGILLQIGFQRRFDAGYLAARDAVCSGALGEPLLVRAAAHDPLPPPEEYIAGSGGLWRDMLIHDFDVVPWVLGREVVEVYADGVAHDPVFARHGDIDAGAALLRFDGGTLGVLTSSRLDPLGHDVRLEVFGSRDSVVVGLGERTPLRSLEQGAAGAAAPAWRDFVERFGAAYAAELDAFLKAVTEGGVSPCNGAEARRALLVAMAAERSIAEHRPVRVEEID
jgi:myo-inositol 2-dehydrogenase / D-chiro-inositol 1-dehydrogenase